MCHWVSNTEKRGRGATFIASNKKASGVYIGGAEVNCGNGSSYFADLASASSSFLNNLRTGSQSNSATVRSNYCKPSENLSGLQSQNQTYSVSGSIISTQNIDNNKIVRYQAGTFVELNSGFVSGNDFVAEINPCVSIVTIIAAKTDNDENIEESENAETLISEQSVNWIKVYPTILPSNTHVTIEANDVVEGTEIFMYDIQGKHVRSFRLNGFLKGNSASVLIDVLPGMYVLKARRGDDLFTQKIIVQ